MYDLSERMYDLSKGMYNRKVEHSRTVSLARSQICLVGATFIALYFVPSAYYLLKNGR